MGRLSILVVVLALGCVPSRTAAPGASAADIVAAAREHGLAVDDPLMLDAAIEADVDHAIGRRGEPRERLHKLVRYLETRGLGWKQLHGVSLPARQAYHQRRGDCMTYALLFVALSRHVGLATYFVHASQVRAFYEKEDSLFAASHIAVGFGEDPGYVVVDFFDDVSLYGLSAYRRIEDAAAVALYFNNVAVDVMQSGRLADAENTLRFLAERRPELAELVNNLAVTLLRQQRHAEALRVVEQAVARFPDYKPLYTNGVQAALGAGRPDLAHAYDARAERIVDDDPLFVFARGLQLYRRAAYPEAAVHFERALRVQDKSLVIATWLVRAHVSAGHREEGRQAFFYAQRLAPDDARVKELAMRYPELR